MPEPPFDQDPFRKIRPSDPPPPRRRARDDVVQQRREVAFPWLVALAITVPVGVMWPGTERAIAIGASCALVLGAALAIGAAARQATIYRTSVGAIEERHANEAQGRVEAMRRQFEWTVDDLVATRKQLRVAELRRQGAEQDAVDVRETLRRRDIELRRTQQKVFELAAIDLTELQAARELSDRRREMAEAESTRAAADANRLRRELAVVSERLEHVSTTLGVAAAAAGEAPRQRASWTIDPTSGHIRIEGLARDASLTAIRIEHIGGDVISRVPVGRDDDTGAVTARLSAEATRALLARGATLKALIEGRWSALPESRARLPGQRDVSPGRPKHLRVVGG